MKNTATAHFDGSQWRCPVVDCKSVLADFKTDANNTPFLLLPRGFVFTQLRRLWLRPKKMQKVWQGAQGRVSRVLMESNDDLKLLLKSNDIPARRQILDADQINDEPLLIRCPNEDCGWLCHIPALRGRSQS